MSQSDSVVDGMASNDEQNPAQNPEPVDPRDVTDDECQRCGTHLSADYRRVMGDNNGRVWCCGSCVSKSVTSSCATADPIVRDAILADNPRGDQL